MMSQKKIVLFDMDGVLAKWKEDGDPKAKGFMLSREPETKAVNLVKKLRDKSDCEVAILSAVYGPEAEMEKVEWLARVGLSDLMHIFVPVGSDKSKVAEDIGSTQKRILVDDFSKNLHQWEKVPGNISVKFRNGINGTHGTWKGEAISIDMTVEQMYNKLVSM